MAEALCQLQEGTLLGAVKLGSILPWERDGDIMVLSDHFSRLLKQLDKDMGMGSLQLSEQSIANNISLDIHSFI